MRRAFTLVELISTMVVVSVMGGVATSIIIHNADAYLQAGTTSQLHHELSVALDRLVRECRRIERDKAASDIAPLIDSVSSDSMAWRDRDGNPFRVERVDGEILLAVDGGAAHVLLDDVTAFSIRTFDEVNTMLETDLVAGACDPVRRVELSITLSRHGVSETLGTKVFIRSTMAGL